MSWNGVMIDDGDCEKFSCTIHALGLGVNRLNEDRNSIITIENYRFPTSSLVTEGYFQTIIHCTHKFFRYFLNISPAFTQDATTYLSWHQCSIQSTIYCPSVNHHFWWSLALQVLDFTRGYYAITNTDSLTIRHLTSKGNILVRFNMISFGNSP